MTKSYIGTSTLFLESRESSWSLEGHNVSVPTPSLDSARFGEAAHSRTSLNGMGHQLAIVTTQQQFPELTWMVKVVFANARTLISSLFFGGKLTDAHFLYAAAICSGVRLL